MNLESIHILDDFVRHHRYGGVMLVAIGVLLPVALAFAYWVYRRRVHPVVVWSILTVAWFGGSQVFPENRSQARELAIIAPVLAAGITAALFHLIRQGRRSDDARTGDDERPGEDFAR